MLSMLTTSSLILIISVMVMLLASILSKKPFNDREKSSPFECGFDPHSSSRMPFSLRFFLIAIIFLIFDVEIALMLPMIMIVKYSMINQWIFTSVFFIIVLIIATYHEWNQGMLSWPS